MPADSLNHPEIVDLGVMSYGAALEQQNIWHRKVVEGHRPVLLTVEHRPVLTLGKNANLENLLFSRDYYLKIGVELFETERGGEVTAHMPGQLVVYPIIDVSKQKLSVRDYVCALESTVIDTLDFFGIHAARDPDLPGVWVKGSKICAIGVRVKSRVTMHGLALNINNDLGLFGKIVPCGIRTRSVTSMSNILEETIAFEDVRSRLLSAIINRLQNN